MADFASSRDGSLTYLTILSDAARDWVFNSLDGEATLIGGVTVVIEPRYAGPILEGIDEAGLTVET